jgi:hypothetical protein
MVSENEAELLLLCARISVDREKVGRIGLLLQGGLDWERLLKMAQRHGLVPLLYRHLNDHHPDLVPAAALNQLRDAFARNKLRNLMLVGELVELLALFERHGIAVIPYKGPILALSVYGDLALRKFGDLDLLLSREHVRQARDLLIKRNYVPLVELDHVQERAFFRFYREYRLMHKNLPVHVELQWRIMPKQFPFSLDVESLRARLQEVRVGGNSILTISPEDLLLILCVHGTKHFWERLHWICDVAEVVDAHRGMNWERLVDDAVTTGSERMLSLGLFLANDLLGAELPEEVSHIVRLDPEVRTLAEEVRGWLFQGIEGSRGLLESSEFHPFHFKIRRRLRDKLSYCIRTVITPNNADWLSVSLPESLFPLYYLLRPIRLAGKYGSRLLRAVS